VAAGGRREQADSHSMTAAGGSWPGVC
jgi:hypothetical protein